MADVTIVTEDAERLVREGGVLNQPDPPWSVAVSVPFTAELELMVDDPEFGPQEVSVGTVTVVYVHHAEECAVRAGGRWVPSCPGGKTGCWHWWVE